MALSERDRRTMTRGGVGLALILGYFFVVEPLWNRHERLVSERDAGRAKIARILANETRAEHYLPQVAEWEARVGGLSDPKLYSEQITTFSQDIMSAAAGTGVDLKEATPTAPSLWADDPGLQLASIVIAAEAEWVNVFNFVATLYRTEGVLSVEHLELSGKDKKVTFTMTVSILVQAPETSELLWAQN